jgi:hypothetical protein
VSDSTSRVHWTRNSILREILRREAQGMPLNVRAICADNESLYKAARRCFGSWSSAMAAAGLRRCSTRSAWRGNARLIIAAIRRTAQHPGELAYSFMMKHRRRLYDAAIHHFGTWKKALLAADIDPDSVRKLPLWHRDSILEAILSRALRNQPLGTTTVRPQSLSTAGISQFGSWPEALRSAGLDPKKYVGIQVRNAEKAIPPKDSEERPFRSEAHGPDTRAGPDSRWSLDRITQEIRRRFREGKALNDKGVRVDDMRLYWAAVQRFRCWSNALVFADLNQDFFRKRKRRSTCLPPSGLNDRSGYHGLVISYSRSATSPSPRNCPNIKRQVVGNRSWIKRSLGPHVPFCEFHDVGSGLKQGKGLRAALNLVCRRVGVFIVEDLTRISRCVMTADGIVQHLAEHGWRVVARQGVPPSEDHPSNKGPASQSEAPK